MKKFSPRVNEKFQTTKSHSGEVLNDSHSTKIPDSLLNILIDGSSIK
jgi:hypothetical protein